MKPAIKRKWVKALLSGKYKQGRSALVYGGKYCCLGVLRHCANPSDDSSIGGSVLTIAQMDEFGLSLEEQDALIELNDFSISGKPVSVPFDMIAGLIDEAL